MERPFKVASLLATAVLILVGCGKSSPNCKMVGLSVTPPNAAADHTMAAPDNQVQFFASPIVASPTGCATTGCVNCSGQTWTVSDPVNASISNNASDNGTATCLGNTNGAVSVTASAQVAGKSSRTVSGTATLTCK